MHFYQMRDKRLKKVIFLSILVVIFSNLSCINTFCYNSSLSNPHIITIRNIPFASIPQEYSKIYWVDHDHIMLIARGKLIKIDLSNGEWEEINTWGDNLLVLEIAINASMTKILYNCVIKQVSLNSQSDVFKTHLRGLLDSSYVYMPAIYIQSIENNTFRPLYVDSERVYYSNLQWITDSSYMYIRTKIYDFFRKTHPFYIPKIVDQQLIVRDLSSNYKMVTISEYSKVTRKGDTIYIWTPIDGKQDSTVQLKFISRVTPNVKVHMPEIIYTHSKPLPNHEDKIFYYYEVGSDSLIFWNLSNGRRKALKLGIRKITFADYLLTPNYTGILFLEGKYFCGDVLLEPQIKIFIFDLKNKIFEALQEIY